MEQDLIETQNNQNKTLVSYCFLASLNNNNADLFNSVYLPLCKRTLSNYAYSNSGGKDIDLQEAMYSTYGIKVPIFTIRQMLKAIEKQMSRKDKTKYSFSVFERGSAFQIKGFVFSELEEQYKQEVRNANGVQLAFEEYLKTQPISIENTPKFVDFIEANKNNLTVYFSRSNKEKMKFDKKYNSHSNFLNHIDKNSDILFQIAKKLYIGSIIATFIETGIDLSHKFIDSYVYYLDTQLILEALDFKNEDSTQPALELLKIIKNSGSDIKVLDITLEEIGYNLDAALRNFNSQPFISHLKNDSIDYACARRRVTKTDLQKIQNDIIGYIKQNLGATIENVSETARQKAGASKDNAELEKIRTKKTAFHDVTAYFYVRERRGGCTRSFQKSKYWFVAPNYNLYRFNISHVDPGCVPEIVTPEALTSLLWLKNPQSLGNNLAKVGISTLIAETISEGLPNTAMLYELDDNLHKYSSVTSDDYELLISSLSRDSVEYIGNLNQLAKEDNKEGFKREITTKVKQENEKRKEQAIRASKTKAENEALQSDNAQLVSTVGNINSKIADISDQLAKTNSATSKTRAEHDRIQKELDGLKKKQKNIIKWSVFIIVSILTSVALWTLEQWIDWSWLDSQINKIPIKIVAQLLIILVCLNISLNKHWKLWVAGVITAIIAIAGLCCK